MSDAVEITMVSPLRSSGLTEIKTWGRSPDAELVVHPYIGYPNEPPRDFWVVSHRRTGKAVSQYDGVPTMDDALALADKLMPLVDWSKIYRDGDEVKGMTFDEFLQAGDKVAAALREARANS